MGVPARATPVPPPPPAWWLECVDGAEACTLFPGGTGPAAKLLRVGTSAQGPELFHLLSRGAGDGTSPVAPEHFEISLVALGAAAAGALLVLRSVAEAGRTLLNGAPCREAVRLRDGDVIAIVGDSLGAPAISFRVAVAAGLLCAAAPERSCAAQGSSVAGEVQVDVEFYSEIALDLLSARPLADIEEQMRDQRWCLEDAVHARLTPTPRPHEALSKFSFADAVAQADTKAAASSWTAVAVDTPAVVALEETAATEAPAEASPAVSEMPTVRFETSSDSDAASELGDADDLDVSSLLPHSMSGVEAAAALELPGGVAEMTFGGADEALHLQLRPALLPNSAIEPEAEKESPLHSSLGSAVALYVELDDDGEGGVHDGDDDEEVPRERAADGAASVPASLAMAAVKLPAPLPKAPSMRRELTDVASAAVMRIAVQGLPPPFSLVCIASRCLALPALLRLPHGTRALEASCSRAELHVGRTHQPPELWLALLPDEASRQMVQDEHFEILVEDFGLTLRNLCSAGTLVNGRRVTTDPVLVHSGSIIGLCSADHGGPLVSFRLGTFGDDPMEDDESENPSINMLAHPSQRCAMMKHEDPLAVQVVGPSPLALLLKNVLSC